MRGVSRTWRSEKSAFLAKLGHGDFDVACDEIGLHCAAASRLFDSARLFLNKPVRFAENHVQDSYETKTLAHVTVFLCSRCLGFVRVWMLRLGMHVWLFEHTL